MVAICSLLPLTLVLLLTKTQASSYNVPLILPHVPSYNSQRARGRRSQNPKQQHVLLASKKQVSDQSFVDPIAPTTTSVEEIPKWEDLSFPWKVVFGGVEIAYTVGTQYLSGFVTAYIFGSLTGLIGLTKPPTDGMTRFARFNQKSVKWGKSWGQISASFSGFDTGVRLLRNNKQDEWNSLFGSACAGAFFVRGQGPEAMAKSALLYAAFGYFFMKAGQKNNQMFVEEQAL